MLKYGFSNLRRLRSVSPVELRPITLLVGRNSSGKSTFLRTLPLFRQSVSTKTSSPILWYGDLVDFGSYDVSVSSDHGSEPVTFTFIIDELFISHGRTRSIGEEKRKDSSLYRDVRFEIHIVPIDKRTRIAKLKIELGSSATKIEMSFDNAGRVSSFIINGSEGGRDISGVMYGLSSAALFPDLRMVFRVDDTALGVNRGLFWGSDPLKFVNAAFKLLRDPLDARISDTTLRDFVGFLFSQTTITRASLKETSARVTSVKFKTFIKDMAENDSLNLFPRLEALIIASALPSIMGAISQHLKSIFGASLYIGPARARSERYYRYQDLSVSEIDPDGKNFPMFLNSLNRKQRQSLSDWVEQLFGYGINISQESGHISIKLVEGESEANIVDVGYGVSQILPVLGQIWWARARPSSPYNSTPLTLLAVEQPELHLHPAHQALLADALVGETTLASSQPERKSKVNFIIETHSETLVNRMGELIQQKKIDKSDVQILLFEPDGDDGNFTKLRSVEYDEEGLLVDWPYGFFHPEF